MIYLIATIYVTGWFFCMAFLVVRELTEKHPPTFDDVIHAGRVAMGWPALVIVVPFMLAYAVVCVAALLISVPLMVPCVIVYGIARAVYWIRFERVGKPGSN